MVSLLGNITRVFRRSSMVNIHLIGPNHLSNPEMVNHLARELGIKRLKAIIDLVRQWCLIIVP